MELTLPGAGLGVLGAALGTITDTGYLASLFVYLTLFMVQESISHNTCILPDKNLERFLNTWLKYQLGLTYVYNRNSQNGGFFFAMYAEFVEIC